MFIKIQVVVKSGRKTLFLLDFVLFVDYDQLCVLFQLVKRKRRRYTFVNMISCMYCELADIRDGWTLDAEVLYTCIRITSIN